MIFQTIKTSLLAMGMSLCLASLQAAPLVTQFTTDGNSNQIVVAADNNNNAVAVLVDDNVVQATYSANAGPWSPLVNLSNTTDVHFNPSVDMDATGTALAMWVGFDALNNYYVETAYFTGGIWTTPIPQPLEYTSNSINDTSIAMDGLGKGLAVWSAGDIHASFFAGGVWTPFVNIGTAVPSAYIVASYSPSGEASAVWTHFDLGISDVYANTYNGTVWQGLINLDTNPTSAADAGIDDQGNTIAIWSSGGNIVTRRFDGTTWSPAQTLSTAPGNLGDPKIAVAFDGTAVAVWTDSANNIQMSLFNGTTWSAPIFVAASSQNPQITMDDDGNALIGWVTLTGDIYFARLPKGSTVLDNVTFIKNSVLPVIAFDLALSNEATTGFAVWNEGIEGSNTFGTSNLFPALPPAPPFFPTPPLAIAGTTCTSTFVTQSDTVNVITFTPSIDPTVRRYYVTRNGEFIAVIPAAGPYIYEDHNRNKGVTYIYTVTAVNAENVRSAPIAVVIN
ncbi:MAG TPA: hypothetical protein VGP47_03220 [Parachlamydiaceae bacterium]|nr:hypothetical protein [Parachlamydiaceae bacterium]